MRYLSILSAVRAALAAGWNATVGALTVATINTFVPASGMTLAKDTDGTLAANSDSNVATQKATKTYADTKAPLASPTFTGTVTAPIVALGAGLSTIERVTADPRTGGLNKAQGTVVLYVNGQASTLLMKGSALGGNAYQWRLIDEKYYLPESSAAFTGLTGLTATSMFKPGKFLNSCPDLIGTNHLTKGAVNGIVTQEFIEGHVVDWFSTTAAGNTADVLDPAAASFYAAAVFTLPGTSAGSVQATSGILFRFDASAFGWGMYWNSGFVVLIKDTSGNTTGTLTFSAPALSPVTSPGTLFLAQLIVDRTNALVNFRLSKQGASPDIKSAVSIAAITQTLTKASQKYGTGAGPVTAASAATAWAVHCSGAQIEGQGQTLLATVESALGFA